jgi:hypothetical protein
MRRLGLVACLLALTAPTGWAAESVPTGYPGLDLIQAAGLMKTVERLASPRYAGRLAGSPGYLAAAREMAAASSSRSRSSTNRSATAAWR